MTVITSKQSFDPETVPLGKGRPTKDELIAHYPAKFTWTQLKAFINSGDLRLLKRDKKLQERYLEHTKALKAQFGSITNYLINHRLQWGKVDTLSMLSPDYDPSLKPQWDPLTVGNPTTTKGLPTLPPDAPKYFTADVPLQYLFIMYNDWPYSVPPEIEHFLVWSRVPFLPEVIPETVRQRVGHYGLWGFAGCSEPPQTPSTLPSLLGALSEWGITLDMLKIPPECSAEEEASLEETGKEIHAFIKNRWPQEEWETGWFVNPPSIQSVPELPHIHVFAKRKDFVTR
ncbi:hypothetical protein M378DRAFT_173119 [Amanita muscaria Koide BX008]|uniref:Uncharacterized protein n=1 Tax=Amanita muscaria (strain Koide BX008) TaxID=946122 RepID=A0A0C2S007_AMAMK|nr:hypothetical protein M378DRAFT_173119 [Amanita muscaria Koide BX008]